VNGLILQILVKEGFKEVNESLIKVCVEEHNSEPILPTIRDHLFYLAGKEKEYIETRKINADEEEVCVKLTPRGVDLFYGLIDDDPGIHI
jgi:hypothetical protein